MKRNWKDYIPLVVSIITLFVSFKACNAAFIQ